MPNDAPARLTIAHNDTDLTLIFSAPVMYFSMSIGQAGNLLDEIQKQIGFAKKEKHGEEGNR